MRVLDIFKRKEVKIEPNQEERKLSIALGYNTISSYQVNQAMRLSAVYAATNMISNSIALLPIKIVRYNSDDKEEINHPLYDVLNLKPNARYNHFNFFKLLIESILLKGNGYCLIDRDSNLNVRALQLIDSDFVTPMPQKDGSVKYLVSGMNQAVDFSNMIHLYQHCDNQQRGFSTLKYADIALHGTYNAEKHADNFFKSGAGLMGILKASAPLTNDQKKQIADSWAKSINTTAGGGVAILPQGLEFQSISISPEDSQLLESRKYNIVEIARFFNISPIKLFDFENNSYSTLEQTSLSYLQDTILPITQLIKDEFNRKLFKPSEVGNIGIDFDYKVLLQTDKQTEAKYYRELLVNGILSINEVRNKLGFTPIEEHKGGDAHFVQISYGTVENVYNGSYIKQTAQDQNQLVDNKVSAQEEEKKPVNKTKKVKKNENI